jgi:hypothetical protein
VALAQTTAPLVQGSAAEPLHPTALSDARQWVRWSHAAMDVTGMPVLEGSNAWAVSGQRTASGRPLLAGDPHIAYSVPAVWYEAHLSSPGFELYGHHQALNPMALLGHNFQFGWSLTMFQNDDMDLVAEKTNPANPNQVWHQGQWVDLQVREETIRVKGAVPVTLSLRRSPNGPIITDAYRDNYGTTPVALWWTFLQSGNPIQAVEDRSVRPIARVGAARVRRRAGHDTPPVRKRLPDVLARLLRRPNVIPDVRACQGRVNRGAKTQLSLRVIQARTIRSVSHKASHCTANISW